MQQSARHLRNLYINTTIPLLASEILVPLAFNFAEGFSAIFNFFGANTNVEPFITPLQAFSLADVPAARQLQYNWVNKSYIINNTIHDAWQQEIKNLGYPTGYPALNKPTRNIAIANGSECGITQVENTTILSYVKDAGRDTFLSNYIGIMDAIYGTILLNPLVVITALFPGKSYWEIDFQSKYMTKFNETKNIYHGSIKYKKKIFNIFSISITITNKDIDQPNGFLPYDIYGGGLFRTPTDQLPLDNITSNAFGFIPTASSLDIGKGITIINDSDYRKSYIGELPPVLPKNSPFNNFVTHYDRFNNNNNNSPHISFNARNGNWLRSELVNVPETTNCSNFCSNASLTGDNYLCGTGTYSVTSEANPANTIWTITQGSSLISYTTNGNSITLNQVGMSGLVTIVASYSNERCGNATVTKTIWVGTPQSVSQTITGGYDNVPISSQSTLNINPVAGAQQYYWWINEISSGCGCTTNGDGVTLCPPGTVKPRFINTNTGTTTSAATSVIINWGNCPGNYVVNCASKNFCGLTAINYKAVSVYSTTTGGGGTNPCTPKLSVAPNPIKQGGTFTANLTYPGNPCNNPPVNGRVNNQVKIFDFNGNLVLDEIFESDTIEIKNVRLTNGYYALNIFTNEGLELREVIFVE